MAVTTVVIDGVIILVVELTTAVFWGLGVVDIAVTGLDNTVNLCPVLVNTVKGF